MHQGQMVFRTETKVQTFWQRKAQTSKADRPSVLPQEPKLFRTEARLQIAKMGQTKQGRQIICFAPGTKALQKLDFR